METENQMPSNDDEFIYLNILQSDVFRLPLKELEKFKLTDDEKKVILNSSFPGCQANTGNLASNASPSSFVMLTPNIATPGSMVRATPGSMVRATPGSMVREIGRAHV